VTGLMSIAHTKIIVHWRCNVRYDCDASNEQELRIWPLYIKDVDREGQLQGVVQAKSRDATASFPELSEAICPIGTLALEYRRSSLGIGSLACQFLGRARLWYQGPSQILDLTNTSCSRGRSHAIKSGSII
jgi:hypothetical protein